jgi:hypothetical protein
MYVNMEELVQQLRKTENLGVYDTAERVNRWITQALDEKRSITVSSKGATDKTTIDVGSVIRGIYGRYSEELIDEFVHITDLSEFGERRLSNVIRSARLHHDDPMAYAKLQEKLLKIMEGDY